MGLPWGVVLPRNLLSLGNRGGCPPGRRSWDPSRRASARPPVRGCPQPRGLLLAVLRPGTRGGQDPQMVGATGGGSAGWAPGLSWIRNWWRSLSTSHPGARWTPTAAWRGSGRHLGSREVTCGLPAACGAGRAQQGRGTRVDRSPRARGAGRPPLPLTQSPPLAKRSLGSPAGPACSRPPSPSEPAAPRGTHPALPRLLCWASSSRSVLSLFFYAAKSFIVSIWSKA